MLKRYLAAGLATLALAAVANAQIIYIPPVKADAGFKAYFRLYWGGTSRCNACAPPCGGYSGFGAGCPGGGGGSSFSCGTGGLQAGPWYSYWPYEAHFQVPAPQPYPYYPSPQVSPYPGGVPQFGPPPTGSGSPGSGSPPGSGSGPGAFQQSAYYPTASNPQAVPSYWYQK